MTAPIIAQLAAGVGAAYYFAIGEGLAGCIMSAAALTIMALRERK